MSRTFLLPFDRYRRLDAAPRYRVIGRRKFFRVLAHHMLATGGFGETRTGVTARIDLQPFQLEPALAILRHGRLRLFIADSVGLGKTIQAGLVLSELAARTDAFRALVAVPAGLRAQWHEELRDRFSIDAVIADTRWLLGKTRDLPADVNPWSLAGVYVVSHDFVKQPEVLRATSDVPWDVLVADEVHGASPGTARLAALQALGARSRRIVLLSATPPDSQPNALRALAEIGRFAGEPPMAILRRSRQDVGDSTRRRTVWLPVRLSGAERLMHARLDAYAARVWRESLARQDPSARLAAMVLKKRALSTASALLASVRRRIAWLGAEVTSRERLVQLPLFEEEPLPDDPDDPVLAAPGLSDVGLELTLLARIAEAAEEAAGVESKICTLTRFLRRVSEPVLIFTEYRDTITQLAGAFAGRQPEILTGGMSPAERHDAQRRFARHGSLLLATDAASEGLNLHHRCRTVVHFELPWVPMRLEQRAGRVDRFGQRRRVHEILLVARHTSERYVLGPLARRIRTAVNAGVQTALASLSESTVAAGVLGDGVLEPSNPAAPSPFECLSLRHEGTAECERVMSLRALASKASGQPPHAIVIRRGRWRSNVVTVLVRIRLEGNGTLLDDRLATVRLLTAGPRPGSLAQMRYIAMQVSRQLTLERLAACGALDAATRVERAIQHATTLLADREAAMAAALSGPQRAVQPGLFDRRALRAADAQQSAATLLLEESHTRIRQLVGTDRRRVVDIVAVHPGEWPER